MNKFGVDTGGTFTDGFVYFEGKLVSVKVETTPHDLTVCFTNCLREGAHRLGIELPQLVKSLDEINFSSTIATNALLQQTGPRLGLLVSRSYFDQIQKNNPFPEYLIRRQMILPIDEGVSDTGEVVLAPAPDQVNESVRRLLLAGAQAIVVSFENSFLNDSNERAIKRVCNEQYPRHYLGAVPVFLSSEVSQHEQISRRTSSALLNGYIHKELAKYLYKAEEELRRNGYRWPLRVVNGTGGTTRVAKTRGLDTGQSGPAAGLMGAAQLAHHYNEPNVITLDIGGTSSDLGVILAGQPLFEETPSLASVEYDALKLELDSVAIGGGSILSVTRDRKNVSVGPRSAGAVPGPACYGIGGTEPTLTDAYLVLGYLDPKYYLGGKRKIDPSLAEPAIKQKLAVPLGLTLPEAATLAVHEAELAVAAAIKRLLDRHSASAKRFALFSFGGGGGMISAQVAMRLGIPRVYNFSLSPVFCAYGAANLDIVHFYERRINRAGTAERSSLQGLSETIVDLQGIALRDFRGEGIQAGQLAFEVQLILSSGHNNGSESVIARKPIRSQEPESVLKELEVQIPGLTSLPVQYVRLKASASRPRVMLTQIDSPTRKSAPLVKEKRTAWFGGAAKEVPVYDRQGLQPGDVAVGPAIVEANDTTVLLPAKCQFRMDKFLSGIIEEAK